MWSCFVNFPVVIWIWKHLKPKVSEYVNSTQSLQSNKCDLLELKNDMIMSLSNIKYIVWLSHVVLILCFTCTVVLLRPVKLFILSEHHILTSHPYCLLQKTSITPCWSCNLSPQKPNLSAILQKAEPAKTRKRLLCSHDEEQAEAKQTVCGCNCAVFPAQTPQPVKTLPVRNRLESLKTPGSLFMVVGG